jgi:hypothetical protein
MVYDCACLFKLAICGCFDGYMFCFSSCLLIEAKKIATSALFLVGIVCIALSLNVARDFPVLLVSLMK